MLTNTEAMQRLREAQVPDPIIAQAFGISRQLLHKRLGPRPPDPPRPAWELPPIHDYDPAELPALLSTWRARRHWTQEEAAGALGVNPWTYRAWEQGRQPCSLPALLLMAIAWLDRLQRAVKNKA